MPLSGPQWINQFPNSSSVDTLADPFKSNVCRFSSALSTAGASVSITATKRPPERAYLMHYCFRIANESFDPSTVPLFPGVDIQWVHMNAQRLPDLQASRVAAQQMVQGYSIVFRPALSSRHTEGKAIDMNIVWSQKVLTIADSIGRVVDIRTSPKNGSGNAGLRRVGAGYRVLKLISDPPHWSSDGH